MVVKSMVRLALCFPEKIHQLAVIDSQPTVNLSTFFKTRQTLLELVSFDIGKYSSTEEAVGEFQNIRMLA